MYIKSLKKIGDKQLISCIISGIIHIVTVILLAVFYKESRPILMYIVVMIGCPLGTVVFSPLLFGAAIINYKIYHTESCPFHERIEVFINSFFLGEIIFYIVFLILTIDPLFLNRITSKNIFPDGFIFPPISTSFTGLRLGFAAMRQMVIAKEKDKSKNTLEESNDEINHQMQP